MTRKTSLKDIASKVGVSASLVSYVLNNKDKENRVSKETANKIRAAAKELNYFPNLNARSLKTNISHTIGLIVADISNPFFFQFGPNDRRRGLCPKLHGHFWFFRRKQRQVHKSAGFFEHPSSRWVYRGLSRRISGNGFGLE